ncbi:alpha/beta fold hydrolase [Nocardioides mangrovicus]|uniref:alpha/beta fold hydrolase n=1 Tax=Nocardioides mangrovicus TaxID=2478913 RepID=UPI0013144634|nr:alpha/beta fold hydrolase [Nocardioides mangrovicus]
MTSAIGAFLCPPEYAGPRGLRALGREGTVALEAYRGSQRARSDRRIRSGQAWARAGRLPTTEPVLLVPGFMAGDWSLARLSAFLRENGWRTYRSGIHLNSGCTMLAAERLEARLEAIAERRGTRVRIVGHSLGGMMARGLAAQRPDLVSGIVTMGSPVLAPGAVHDLLGWNTRLLARLARAGVGGTMTRDCVAGDCARASWEATQAPLSSEVDYTALFSRRDGIVDWRSCLDPAAEHVEVGCSHVGMAVDPAVHDVVLDALTAQRASRRAALSDAAGPRRVGSR